MADTPAPSAAPAAAPVAPAQAATQQVLNTLPPDPKAPKKGAETVVEDVVEDTGDDLGGEGTPSQKKAVADAKKAYKLKVNGKDLEVDEAELLKRAQMGYSAEQRWQETAQLKKQMDGFVQLLQRDPEKALEQMGYDVDKLAEDRIQKRIAEMQKSPEQLEKEKMQRELEEMKAEREREKNETNAREMQRIQDQYAIELENDISSALDSNDFGFPKTPYVVKRFAENMMLAIQEGIRTNNPRLKNITAKDVLPIVEQEIRQELNDMYAAAPDEVFEKLIGKDRLNKYRRAKIKKTTGKPTTASEVKQTGAKELNRMEDTQTKKKVSAKDFFKTLGSGKV